MLHLSLCSTFDLPFPLDLAGDAGLASGSCSQKISTVQEGENAHEGRKKEMLFVPCAFLYPFERRPISISIRGPLQYMMPDKVRRSYTLDFSSSSAASSIYAREKAIERNR